ncbi:MAG TPA: RHS repeat-associated core domain-containing protein [Thermoanaerobaculia bacterium]|nr:RHS repeat-associated core domain-containing protein [Thermoanaerobaculia bacterium]
MTARPRFALLVLVFTLQATTGFAAGRDLRPKTDDGPSSATYGPILYDPVGNIIVVGASYYVYDSLNRVKRADVEHNGFLQTQTYTYDAYGNRTSDGTLNYSVNAATNRLTSFGATYDTAGNLTSWQPDGWAISRQYTYDALNSLIYEEVDPVRSRHHVYTAFDERFWTLTGSYGSSCPNGICSESKLSVRDLQGLVLREFTDDGSGATAWQHEDYVYRDGQFLAAVTPEETHHYSLDHLGTPRVVTAQDGYEVGRHTYFPFGAEITDGSPTDGRLRFTGHEERDEDLAGDVYGQLDYMHARYYASLLGRFLSVDPILGDPQIPQSWNRYAYVMNNPLRLEDPTGENATLVCESNNVCVATVSAQIIADPNDPEQMKAATDFKDAATQYWESQQITGPNGETVTVDIDLTIVAPACAVEGVDTLTVVSGYGRAEVTMTGTTDEGQAIPDFGAIYTRDSTGNRSGMQGIAPHEVGHLLGLRDLYAKDEVVPYDPNPSADLMRHAQPTNKPHSAFMILHCTNFNVIRTAPPK